MMPSPFTSVPATVQRVPAAAARAQVRPAWQVAVAVLLLACGALLSEGAAAAGRNDLSQGVREPSSAERPARVQEMRRQLLEHHRYWRGNAAENPSRTLRDLPPAAPGAPMPVATPPTVVVPLAAPLAAPLGIVPSVTPVVVNDPAAGSGVGTSLPDAVLPASAAGITPVATPATAPSIGDARLTDRERSQLRQQLRQLPRLRPAARGNPAGSTPGQ